MDFDGPPIVHFRGRYELAQTNDVIGTSGGIYVVNLISVVALTSMCERTETGTWPRVTCRVSKRPDQGAAPPPFERWKERLAQQCRAIRGFLVTNSGFRLGSVRGVCTSKMLKVRK